jgi:hypothetical protein
VLVQQVLGAIGQFEKTSLVAKLKAARDRKRATGVKVEGRRSHSELRPEVVAAAKLLHKQERLSYREISARLFEAGHINKHGGPFSASSIKSMLQSRPLTPARRQGPVYGAPASDLAFAHHLPPTPVQ